MAKYKRNLKTNARIPWVVMLFPILIGLVFVCIGIFVAIPEFGTFGYFWTAISVIVMIFPPIVMAVMNRRMAKGVDIESTVEHESDVEVRLEKLEKLYNDGTITKEEYDKARANIISQL